MAYTDGPRPSRLIVCSEKRDCVFARAAKLTKLRSLSWLPFKSLAPLSVENRSAAADKTAEDSSQRRFCRWHRKRHPLGDLQHHQAYRPAGGLTDDFAVDREHRAHCRWRGGEYGQCGDQVVRDWTREQTSELAATSRGRMLRRIGTVKSSRDR